MYDVKAWEEAKKDKGFMKCYKCLKKGQILLLIIAVLYLLLVYVGGILCIFGINLGITRKNENEQLVCSLLLIVDIIAARILHRAMEKTEKVFYGKAFGGSPELCVLQCQVDESLLLNAADANEKFRDDNKEEVEKAEAEKEKTDKLFRDIRTLRKKGWSDEKTEKYAVRCKRGMNVNMAAIELCRITFFGILLSFAATFDLAMVAVGAAELAVILLFTAVFMVWNNKSTERYMKKLETE